MEEEVEEFTLIYSYQLDFADKKSDNLIIMKTTKQEPKLVSTCCQWHFTTSISYDKTPMGDGPNYEMRRKVHVVCDKCKKDCETGYQLAAYETGA